MFTIWLIWHFEEGRERWMLARIRRDVRSARAAIHPDFSAMAARGHILAMPMRLHRGMETRVEGEAYFPFGSRRAWIIDENGNITAPPRG